MITSDYVDLDTLDIVSSQFRHFNGISASAADRAALYNGGLGA